MLKTGVMNKVLRWGCWCLMATWSSGKKTKLDCSLIHLCFFAALLLHLIRFQAEWRIMIQVSDLRCNQRLFLLFNSFHIETKNRFALLSQKGIISKLCKPRKDRWNLANLEKFKRVNRSVIICDPNPFGQLGLGELSGGYGLSGKFFSHLA